MPRALLSVSDKTGLIPFAQELSSLGYELVSTGGTFRTLKEAGIAVTPVSEVTSFPEILGGRVKTLHPFVHGGILAKRNDEHLKELQTHQITPIDLLVVNLYPFRETVAKTQVSQDEALENIDIGGPTMIRAAAKNFPSVAVVVDPNDYDAVADALKGGLDQAYRKSLARKAFAHTAAYDAAIVNWFDKEEALPPSLHFALERKEVLRYGENPHQQAARYSLVSSLWDNVIQHKGMGLSHLNLYDSDAAWQLAHEFEQAAAVVVKHANPCGVAIGTTIQEAYNKAFACDPKSAFGGIVALNKPVDTATAEAIMNNAKADVLLAPSYSPDALDLLKAKRKNMRVLEAIAPKTPGLDLKRIDGGFLVQEDDAVSLDDKTWNIVSKAKPNEAQWQDLKMAWLVCAYTKSNAIVLVADGQAVGIGAGQQSRVDAGVLAAQKAAGRAKGGACASDAFYPFRDGLDAAAAAGVAAVIQPGGSIRDEEVITAANEHGIAMVFTGTRHFRH